MGSATSDGSPTTDLTQFFITIPTELHLIQAITLYDLAQASDINSAWALIGIMAGGRLNVHKLCTLASGYIGKASELGWSGTLYSLPDWFLFAEIYGDSTVTYRLSAVLHKISEGEGGQLVIHP